jgi:6,7-dimethyl-8-ribityllumazine synthase
MIAIVKANFNQEITDKLLNGCTAELDGRTIPYKVFVVPGAVETVGITRQLLDTSSYTAVIVLGAVIKGDTDHYQFVCDYVTQGLSQLSTQATIPIIFGILTTFTEEHALERACPTRMNKGKEFAATALEMIDLYRKIKE